MSCSKVALQIIAEQETSPTSILPLIVSHKKPLPNPTRVLLNSFSPRPQVWDFRVCFHVVQFQQDPAM